MRRIAFVIALFGIFILTLFLHFGEVEVDSLEGLEANTRAIVSGEVVSQRVISSGLLLELDNGIVAVCDCSGSFEGKEVEILGIVSEYRGEKQLEVLRIVY